MAAAWMADPDFVFLSVCVVVVVFVIRICVVVFGQQAVGQGPSRGWWQRLTLTLLPHQPVRPAAHPPTTSSPSSESSSVSVLLLLFLFCT